MESLKDLEEYVDDSIQVFLTRMEEMQGKSIDMGKWVQLFAFGMNILIYMHTILVTYHQYTHRCHRRDNLFQAFRVHGRRC